MSESKDAYADNDLREVKQLGMWASIASLSYIFWIVGGMELVERIAYYGVKASAGLYAKAPVSNGGLGISLSDYGIIIGIWAMMQTFVPVFTGGISDRVGYKETIFASTLIKISGYLVMAFFPSFYGFLFGAILLAAGTGVFKPGIQGTLVLSTGRQNTSMAWGIFYQVVNIGGFLGPLVAVHMRQLSWDYVFFACAAIISFNFLFLLAYKEPGKEERLERNRKIKSGEIKQVALWRDALHELKKPIVIYYMLVFAGFWFLFNSLFDVLPIHIAEWVDTSVIVTSLFGPEGTTNGFFQFWLGLDNTGTKVMPEGMLNLNAGMIMTTCFLVAALTAKYRITSAMLGGCLLSILAFVLVGATNAAWMIVFAIAMFSFGEMMISPKKNEFMGNIAPEGKKAMYLGFVMLPQGIGWTLEGFFGPKLYEMYASKEIFSRELLVDRGMSASDVSAIPLGEAFSTLVTYTGEPAQQLTTLLYNTHNIGMAWYIIAAIGSISAIGIYLYGKWLFKLQQR
ncbi:MFS transporter [Shewanella sp. Choline-02u-19]|jgi:POT family proton-dependent oligopeptide transporter|uniref:MFS transporter n=1 Tax=unclassified Shewanella TaxID=196818 RepID=UPI000C341141|nr:MULTISPECIES: MFS transporter [unclassified Shewanella]PKG55938.1 MFS transporter [Shewanella sp. GutDb-MelDb]PKG76601.1 MFS transporter [Shewanella sp. GutCb]PKH56233.1 MFS transporter [Shewanella sp. Bg11-22]PKI28697.1 MFS transporter [Shewanella sp. Choline-02u-19]